MRAAHQSTIARTTRRFFVVPPLVVLLVFPTFARSSAVTRCFNNLKNVDIAKQIVAQDRNLKTGDVVEPSWIADELEIRTCPSGGTYTIGPVGTPPTCSITNHTPAEVERTFARWRRERRIDNAKIVASSIAIVALPIAALIYALRWYRRSKNRGF